MENDELQIIERCQAGHLEDFCYLYDSYFRKIYNFIYFKTHHRQSAEDLTSQAFFKALENIKKFSPAKGQFSSWLYRIARNSVIDFYRGRKNEADIADIWDLSSPEDMAADAVLKEQLERVKEYLTRFDSQQREIIIMRVWDGLSYREISEILGKSEASCKMSFCRGLAKLREAEMLALLILGVLIGSQLT